MKKFLKSIKDYIKSNKTDIAIAVILPIVLSVIIITIRYYINNWFPKTWSKENDDYIKKLHRKFRKPIAKLINDVEKELGIKLKIISGYRSIDKQQKLYDELEPQGKPVARAGYSYHNYGLAVDFDKKDYATGKRLTSNDFRKIEQLAGKYDILSGISFNDPNHFYKKIKGKEIDDLYAFYKKTGKIYLA